jgi:hypothetical protein
MIIPRVVESRSYAGYVSGGARTIEFGKYKGFTFQEVLQVDKGYGAWVLKACAQPDSSPNLKEFGEFLQEHAAELQTAASADKQNDFAPEACSNEGAKQIMFGKYRGQTFEDVLQGDRGFCAWVLRTSYRDDSGQPLREFGAFLQKRAPELMSFSDQIGSRTSSDASGVISFGKYKGQTYEQIWQSDPDFCQWVQRAAGNPNPGQGLLAFAEFLSSKEEVRAADV